MSTQVNLEVKVVEGYRGKPSVYLEIDMREDGATVVVESRGISRIADLKEFFEDIAAMIEPEPAEKKPMPFNPQPTGAQQ